MNEEQYGDPELDRWIEERAREIEARERGDACKASFPAGWTTREFWVTLGLFVLVVGGPILAGPIAGVMVDEVQGTPQIESIGDPALAAPLIFQDSSGNELQSIVDSGTTGALPPVTLHLGAGESYYNKVMLRDPVLSPVRFERGVRCVCQAVTPLDGVACETLLSADGTLEISLSPRQREFVEVAYVCVAPLAR